MLKFNLVRYQGLGNGKTSSRETWHWKTLLAVSRKMKKILGKDQWNEEFEDPRLGISIGIQGKVKGFRERWRCNPIGIWENTELVK